MNPLHKDQLKLSFRHYYGQGDNQTVNVDQLKRANSLLTKKNPNRESQKLLAHIIRNRNQNHQGYSDEQVHYEEFQQRVDRFLSEEEKNDQTTVDLLFELLDQDKDGVLNVEDLAKFLTSVGSTMEQKEVVELLELMTAEGTSLTKREFLLILNRL